MLRHDQHDERVIARLSDQKPHVMKFNSWDQDISSRISGLGSEYPTFAFAESRSLCVFVQVLLLSIALECLFARCCGNKFVKLMGKCRLTSWSQPWGFACGTE